MNLHKNITVQCSWLISTHFDYYKHSSHQYILYILEGILLFNLYHAWTKWSGPISSVSAVYGVISWGTTIRFMTCRAALQRFRDFTKLSCAAGPRFRKPFLSWRESRALPLKFVQSRYGLGQHCMCNNVVAHLWFWPSFVTVFVVPMLCVKAHSQ